MDSRRHSAGLGKLDSVHYQKQLGIKLTEASITEQKTTKTIKRKSTKATNNPGLQLDLNTDLRLSEIQRRKRSQ